MYEWLLRDKWSGGLLQLVGYRHVFGLTSGLPARPDERPREVWVSVNDSHADKSLAGRVWQRGSKNTGRVWANA
ncbi:hypothetical protein [Paenirhodobacter populi]|uniref:Uncharacterized protein n=1 Tax=Paenirhodobacter populi TaxID=2306993 RepID=A0A443J757_9RHOB|nr:hypothetical protein [Sinirhodobacter populi]RWR16379.1 hypothetical protein D2T30_21915 [Sinirhodobacter populi]